MFGGKNPREQDTPYDARQGSLFPQDPPYRLDEGLKLHHYLIGGVLVATMLGVLVTGYFYSRSLVIKEPKEETTVAAAPAAQPAPSETPAPPSQKIESPAAPAQTAEKAAPKPEPAAEKKAPAAKPETASAEKTGARVYFIQLAAFKDPHQTAQLCKQIEPLGFKCYFGNVDTPDGRYWRLRLGPYEAKNQAEGDLAKLQAKGFDGRLIPLRKSGVKAPLQLPL